MPYIRQADNTIRMTFEGAYAPNGIVNVFHFRQVGGVFGQPAIDAQVLRCRDSWQGNMMDVFPNQYTFIGGSVLSLDPLIDVGYPYEPNGALPLVGAVSGSSSAPQVATLVTKQTPIRPRGFRGGRTYFPPTPDANVDEAGIIDAATVLAWSVALDGHFTQCVGVTGPDDWQMVIPSYPGLESPPPEEPTPVEASDIVVVEGLQMQNLVATQRRRVR